MEKLFNPIISSMNSLAGFTKEQLQQEIDRREFLAKMPEPSGLSKDERESKVQELVIELIANHGSKEEREDDDHYFFEAVMEIYYGHEIWKWWNSIRN
jgi:hypothetical protein